MPRLCLATWVFDPPVQVVEPSGSALRLPRLQLRARVWLPGIPAPRDAVVDTGSPFTWLPESIWSRFTPGTDFEWLPFAPGYTPPQGSTAGWTYSFRMARMLTPLTPTDTTTRLDRPNVIAQFADGDPPDVAAGRRQAFLVIGFWGGVLDYAALSITPNLLTGGVDGALEF